MPVRSRNRTPVEQPGPQTHPQNGGVQFCTLSGDACSWRFARGSDFLRCFKYLDHDAGDDPEVSVDRNLVDATLLPPQSGFPSLYRPLMATP